MIPFMFIIVILIMGFAWTYNLKDGFEEATISNLNSGFMTQWKVTMGDFGEFDTAEFDKFELTLFILLSLIMPLIFLNLLVAILSEAHGNVMDCMEATENAQMN